MNRKHTYIALCVLAPAALIGGLVLSYFAQGSVSAVTSDLSVNLMMGLFFSMPGFLVLWAVAKIMRLCAIEKKSVKPFVFAALIASAVTAVVCGLLSADKKPALLWYDAENVAILLYTVVCYCLYLAIFMYDVDERRFFVTFEGYAVRERKATKTNKDNLPVTVYNLRAPESYFEDVFYKERYEEHAFAIARNAEAAAKLLIFKNHFEADTSGEWYISRIDYLADEECEGNLYYYMTFISAKRIAYSFYGLSLGSETKESDFCRVCCEFSYNRTEGERGFVLENADIELL